MRWTAGVQHEDGSVINGRTGGSNNLCLLSRVVITDVPVQSLEPTGAPRGTGDRLTGLDARTTSQTDYLHTILIALKSI